MNEPDKSLHEAREAARLCELSIRTSAQVANAHGRLERHIILTDLIAPAAQLVTRLQELVSYLPENLTDEVEVAKSRPFDRARFADVTAEAVALLDHVNLPNQMYAGHPDRGASRGFAALHDVCDANMLLPGADDENATFDCNDEKYVAFCNQVMAEATRLLIANWETAQAYRAAAGVPVVDDPPDAAGIDLGQRITRQLRTTAVKDLTPDECRRLLVHNHGGSLTDDRRKAYLFKAHPGQESAYFSKAEQASIALLIKRGI